MTQLQLHCAMLQNSADMSVVTCTREEVWQTGREWYSSDSTSHRESNLRAARSHSNLGSQSLQKPVINMGFGWLPVGEDLGRMFPTWLICLNF